MEKKNIHYHNGKRRAVRWRVVALEELGGLTAIAFDKTGTLTEDKPQLTRVVALGKLSEDEILEIFYIGHGI